MVARWQTEKTFSDDPSVKLRPNKIGPYNEIYTMKHTVVVGVDRLRNDLSVNRVSLARNTNKIELRCNVTGDVTEDETQQEAMPHVGNERGYARYSCYPETGTRKQRHVENVNNEPQEYLVQKPVDHWEDNEGTLYRVRQFGYSANEDTWEPSENFPQHFVAGYWKGSKNATATFRQEKEDAEGGESEETN